MDGKKSAKFSFVLVHACIDSICFMALFVVVLRVCRNLHTKHKNKTLNDPRWLEWPTHNALHKRYAFRESAHWRLISIRFWFDTSTKAVIGWLVTRISLWHLIVAPMRKHHICKDKHSTVRANSIVRQFSNKPLERSIK